MKNKLRRNSLIISFLVSAIVFGLYWSGFLEKLENRSLDFRFKIRKEEKQKSPVVVAKIDEGSLQTIGNWPWPRQIHAQLADLCRKAGAKALVFDILFSEPDKYNPYNDNRLGESIRKNGRTISAFDFRIFQEEVIGQDSKTGTESEIVDVVLKELPIKKVEQWSHAVGFVNVWPDPDGNLRRANLTYDFEEETYYALNLQAVCLAKNQSAEEVLKTVPTEDSSAWDYSTKESLINWRGSEKSFESHSYAQLLDQNVPQEWRLGWLKEKIVLVGSTALGLFDHYNTPFQSQFPGVYVHANIIDNILAGDFLKPENTFLTIFLIFFFGLGNGILVSKLSAWLSALLSLILVSGLWGLGTFLMVKKLNHIELVAPTFSILGNYLFLFFYRFVVEQKEKMGIKRAFGVYVNPHVVDQIAKNPNALKLGGEVREMSVMFSDVESFTSISEKLTPSELVHLLNLYLTAMTDTIMKYDGTVDKYEGDAIMAFWGAPLLQLDHAQQACLAVLENRKRIAELNIELEKNGMQRLSARCGINTGSMNVGNMGSTQKFNYTVMGDSVNLASRLEGANKEYRTHLMISETTYEQSREAVEVRELDLLRVKGKNLPIKVFELVCKKGELTDSQKRGFDLYLKGLSFYREKNFNEALKKFHQVQEWIPNDGPTETYIQRTKGYIDSPPSEKWDGVFTMTTK